MRHTRVAITGCLVIALSASARSGLCQERGRLEAVKDLYESAAYEEALSTLDRIDIESSAAQIARQYRALCLVALNRSSDAERTLEEMVRADPGQPAPEDFPPRLAAMFGRIREGLLPTLALEQYKTAKLSFDRKDYAAAIAGFDRLVALLADSAINASANPALGDIRTLATGFQQLARLSVAPTPTPVATGSASGGEVPPRRAAANAAVVPAVAIRQELPAWPSGIAINRGGTTYSGLVQVTITPEGDVASLRFIKPVHPTYDRLIETAAKSWKYQPATSNGIPVTFTKLVIVEVADKAGRP